MIVGIVVLVALLIIFVPHFSKGVPTELKPLTIPNLPSSPSPDQFSPGLSDTSQSLSNPFKLPLAPAKAWVLQLADFKESSGSNSLTQALRQKGFKAYTRQIMLPTGQVTRVFVGPETNADKIKLLATRLNKEMQLKPTVAAFDPLLF